MGLGQPLVQLVNQLGHQLEQLLGNPLEERLEQQENPLEGQLGKLAYP
jgi:hypothetical protein